MSGSVEDSGSIGIRVALLGRVRVWVGGVEVAVGAPQQRAVLAVLVGRRHPVGVSAIVDGVWGDAAPPGAVSVVRTYVSRLRKVLESGGAPRVVLSAGDGYVLRRELVSSDLDDVENRVLRAEQARADGEFDSALQVVRDVLEEWEDAPLLGVPGPFAASLRVDVRERRLRALEFKLRLELECGEHVGALGELRALCDEHPLRESFRELLILALYRSGRRGEALDAYSQARRALVDELGIEPGPSLRELQARVLADDPSLGVPRPTGGPPEPASPARIRPSQLPADLPTFTGRRTELERFSALLCSGESSVAVLDGMAGAGKTTLAVHWAHQVSDAFPDGNLYVNLRGYDPGGARMEPGEALETFLMALGVAAQAVPEGIDAQAALYRSVLAERRVLIVLDNAGDTEQVRPLLPGASGCLVVVTSRSRLTGLVAREGAAPFTLGLLGPQEARELLARRVGQRRVDAEPRAADAIVELCARLPLALAIVAARASYRPGFQLSDIVEELREDHGSLDAFVAGDDIGADARAVFSWSYHALSPGAAELFRRLALHPGPDVSAAVAAALTGVERRRVRPALSELTGASLLIEQLPGRYVFHDLLRAYAQELTADLDGRDVREGAAVRMFDHYLHTALHASAVLSPFRETIPQPPTTTDSGPVRFDDSRQATDWLRTERNVLRAVVEHAVSRGQFEYAWRTAHALDLSFDRLGFRRDLMEINKAALRAARVLGDPVAQAHALRSLGFGHTRIQLPEEAMRLLAQALELFRAAGDAFGRARTHRAFAYQANALAKYDISLGHYAQAGELYRSLGHHSGEASVLNEIGWTYILLGEPERALENCELAIALHRKVGDPSGEASAQDSVGYALHHLGRYDDAVERYETAVQLYQRIGNRYLEADTLRHIGDSRYAAGEFGSARAAWGSALVLLEEGGHGEEAEEVRLLLEEGPSGDGSSGEGSSE